MKKKHRRAVFYTISGIICLIASPILLMGGMGSIAEWVCEKFLTPMVGRLKTKWRVYDTDPE